MDALVHALTAEQEQVEQDAEEEQEPEEEVEEEEDPVLIAAGKGV